LGLTRLGWSVRAQAERVGAGCGCSGGHDRACCAFAEHERPAGGGVDGPEYVLGIGVLEEVSVQPGSQASHDGLIVGVHGEDDHAQVGPPLRFPDAIAFAEGRGMGFGGGRGWVARRGSTTRPGGQAARVPVWVWCCQARVSS
jgi:hypothetical protein